MGLPLVVLLGGGVVGAAALGMVKVPFLPFGKKKGPPPPPSDPNGGPFAPFIALAAGLERQSNSFAPPKRVHPPEKPDTAPGEAKLASLWAEMPVDRLTTLVAAWPEAQLGRILALMDDEAVTNLLAALPPPRAASLSRALAAATDERAAKVHTADQK